MQNRKLTPRAKARKNRRTVTALLDWIDSRFPGAKNKIMMRTGLRTATIGSLGESDEFDYTGMDDFDDVEASDDNWLTSIVDDISEAAKEIIPAYTNYRLNKEAYEIQMERARRGLPPIDMSTYGAAPVRVEVRVPPEQFKPQISQETKQTLLWGAAIIAGIYFIPKLLDNG